jgi:hypothetical protein
MNGGEEKCIWVISGKAGRIILRWMLERQDRVVWTGLVWFSVEPGGQLM